MAAYLDDVIVFYSELMTHVKTIRALFERLYTYNLKPPLSKARLGATDSHFLGHSFSPAGVCPNAENVSALIKFLMPRNLQQVRALIGGVGNHSHFLPDLSDRICPIIALPLKGLSTILRRLWRSL